MDQGMGFFWNLLGQLLLPLFVMALLFGFAGVSPDLVIRSSTAIVLALMEHAFSLIGALLNLIFKRPRYPK